MKKTGLLIIILCLLFSVCAFSEEQDFEPFYHSSFEQDPDGWYAKGTDGASIQVSDQILTITNRSGKTQAPAKDLELEKGKVYTISLEIMQSSKAKVDFNLSVEHSSNGIKSYDNMSKVTAKKGEWTAISGELTAGSYDYNTLYIACIGQNKIDYSIRNVTINVADPNKLTPVVYEGDLPILKDIYSDYFDFGTCMSQMDTRILSRASLVAGQYNIITPENELKPDSVLDVSASRKLALNDETAVAVHFDNALPLLNFAKANGLKMHGHVLVWHSQTPEEFFHKGYDRNAEYVSREIMLARLENYIRLVFDYIEQNYPYLFVSWDVANECVADGSTELRSSNWTKVVGNDFVAKAFEYADKYAPDYIKLYYNDYSTPYEPKLTGIVKLLKNLTEEGHIDGYGFQSHYGSTDPSIEAVKTAFSKISSLGLRLRVSELDIAVSSDNDINRKAQAAKYSELMALYLSYADEIDAVQVWGVSDGTSWIKEKYPLMFDANLQPKQSFFAVAEMLQ